MEMPRNNLGQLPTGVAIEMGKEGAPLGRTVTLVLEAPEKIKHSSSTKVTQQLSVTVFLPPTW